MAVAAPTVASIRDRVVKQAGRSRRVKLIDRLATGLITLGGLFIIVAVLFIFIFILGETLPLFRASRGEARGVLELATLPAAAVAARGASTAASGGVAPSGSAPAPPTTCAARRMVVGIDEYQRYLYALLSDASVVFFNAQDGSFARQLALPGLERAEVVSASRSTLSDFIGIGLADGRLSMQQVRFRPRYEEQKLVDLDLEVSDRGTVALDPDKRPLRAVAYEETEGRKTALGVATDTQVLVYRTDDEGGEHRGSLETQAGDRITHVRIGRSDTAVAATDQGNLYHWELAPEIRLTETKHVSEAPITAIEFTLGSLTLVVGDQRGESSGWFRVRLRDENTELNYVKAHSLAPQGVSIAAVGVSTRDKSFATVGADGSVVLRHMTSERTLLEFPATGQAPIQALVTPKNDALLVVQQDGRVARYSIENPHPEISWKALFGKVWYEGYAKPEYVWQSTGATDDFEAKFSLVPVVFGTIKGTLYALLFAVPLAILAALYTSQFMHPRLKAKIKPTVEIMAALPSVVVGFIAGLWLASRVEREIVPVLLMIVLLPLFGTLGIFLWDRLPRAFRNRLGPGMEIALIVPLVFLGGLAALWLGPATEGALFRGDFRLWLQSALDVVYDQRNCLVVGLAMGFAVIPIIFTIAEDSFSSVPQHLTAASLALGASRWQTAVRVVLPTASPGIFSAIMIGFGRAVGETMIVLMATGNTPVLDWSMFNGMRTLSANIAVEIPEAPYGGTLYRTLFLAGLVLFLMTFLVNTIAEVIRQRLRERYRAI